MDKPRIVMPSPSMTTPVQFGCDGTWFTADQLRAFYLQGYAAGAAAERQRCAQDALDEMVELVGPGDDAYNRACEHIADAIRKGAKNV
jgi:hypothetical protein